MTELLIIFIVLLIVVGLMSIGVIFGRQPLKGSCGGLGAVGVEKVCGCSNGGCANDKA